MVLQPAIVTWFGGVPNVWPFKLAHELSVLHELFGQHTWHPERIEGPPGPCVNWQLGQQQQQPQTLLQDIGLAPVPQFLVVY